MKIRLISDIHAEFGFDTKLLDSHGADVLVIAGDLHVGPEGALHVLSEFAKRVEHVIYTPGNHEFYNRRINCFDNVIMPNNVRFLNPGSVKINGITFIVATLWTNFQKDPIAEITAGRAINDFSTICNFNTDACVALHEEQLEFIREAYYMYQGTKVMVTHFLPASECVHPKFGQNILNKYFANDLGCWISTFKDVPYWLFGHTHENVDIRIGDTRLIANPYGYGYNNNYIERFIEL